eukprot:164733-Rhodomonas_salina.1
MSSNKKKNKGGQGSASGAGWETHDYATLMNTVKKMVDTSKTFNTVEAAMKGAKDEIDANEIKDAVHIWGVVYYYVKGVNAVDPESRLWGAHNEMESAPLKGYTDYKESSGLLLSDKDVVLAVVRYQLLDSAMLRA